MIKLQKKFSASMFLAAILILFAGITSVQAQENILGDWVFTMEMPDMGGGMGGPGGGGMPSITISSTFTKADEGAITGTWEMNFEMPEGGGMGMGGPGGGGFQMPAFKIVDVKIDGQNLSFTRTTAGDAAAGGMGGGMMMEDQQFTGTIKGDAIELTSSSQMGEMTYKGTRKAAATPTANGDALVGDWELTMTMADSGMGMGEMTFDIKSTISKNAEGKYAMTWEQTMNSDMGGMGGGMPQPTVTISDIKLDGEILTFVQKVAFGDMGGGMGMGPMEMTSKFTGTVKDGKIDGKMVGEDNGMGMGAMEFALTGKKVSKAPVAAAPTGLEGGWDFVTTFGDMGMEIKANATFTKAADGTFSCKWESLPMEGGMGGPGGEMPEVTVTISDIKVDGEKVTFVQNVDMGGMGGMVSNFAGTLKGDKIEGSFTMDMGEMPSVATRKKAAASAAGSDVLTGDWELTMTMADSGMGMGEMTFDIKSTISKDAEGKYAMTWEQTMNAPEGGMGGGMGGDMPQPEITISDIKLDGETLTFVQKVAFGDMGGGMGMGPMEMTSKFTGTVKDGTIDGKMVGEDNGMGMGAMEFALKGSKK